MNVSVDIEGLDAICDALTNAGDSMLPDAVTGLEQGMQGIVRDAKKLCPRDTGELRNSIRAATREYASFAVGEVSASTEYAVYVEMGTGDRGRESGGNGSPVKASYRTGWKGMAARPYLYPAFRMNKDKVLKAIRNAIRKGLKKG